MATRGSLLLIGSRALQRKVAISSIVTMLIVLMSVASGCIREDDITLEQRAHQLAGELMCPICDAQTIDGSSAQISQDMRAKVRDLLQEGKTNAEIKEYFVARYGEEILASPEGGGFNLIAWVVPVFIVVGGIGIALVTVRNMRRSNVPVEASSSGGDGQLAEYLAQVDKDLGISSQPDDREPNVAPRSGSNEKAST